MPMWCGSSDAPCGPSNIPQPHHRIVRIPPGESVVLNSAERAPYLLLIEILHDDLDFDPSKRANKEVLRKIVAKENERKGASKDLVPFGRGKSKQQQQPQQNTDDADLAAANPRVPPSLIVQTSPPSTATPGGAFPPTDMDNPEEEIDLVEQLYGSEQPLRSANLDLAESIVLPPAPKNRDLDMAAWSASVPSTPSMEGAGQSKGSQFMRRSQSGSGNVQTSNGTTAPPAMGQSNDGHGVLSLDDYSERMRTAAIMLAQLNANMVREQVSPMPIPHSASIGGPVPVTPDTTAPTSRGTWIPGTSWLTGSSSTTSNDATSPHPDHHPPMTPTPSQGRMRLQHAEAQQIRDRIMKEMLALEEERMERMKENRSSRGGGGSAGAGLGIRGVEFGGGEKTAEDEGIIRRELNKADPSAVVFSESWAAKKVRLCALMFLIRANADWEDIQSRIKGASPYGHLGTIHVA